MFYANRDAWCVITPDVIPDVPAPYAADQVRAYVVRPGTTDQLEITLAEEDVKQVDGQIHYLRVPGSFLPSAGDYLLKVEILEDPQLPDVAATMWHTLDVAEPPRAYTPGLDTCLLVGDVRTLGGMLPQWQSVEVFYRPQRLPTIQSSVAVVADTVTTRTDADGHFEMPCVRGASIVFEIPKCAVRFQYQVPWDQDVINVIDVFQSMLNS